MAQWVDDKLQVWCHSQGVFPLRVDLAKALRMPQANITVTHREGSGCYGHNGADDVAFDAALLARAVPGVPVKLQWMREDEFGWEPLGSPMVIQLKASLDAGGKVTDWSHELWSHTHTQAANTDPVAFRLRHQIEGGIVQSTSWTLHEAIKYDTHRLLTRNWVDYPILRFPDVPVLQVELINRPDERPLGVGEGSQGPSVAAIANAFTHATGRRLRDLPFTPERVKQALA